MKMSEKGGPLWRLVVSEMGQVATLVVVGVLLVGALWSGISLLVLQEIQRSIGQLPRFDCTNETSSVVMNATEYCRGQICMIAEIELPAKITCSEGTEVRGITDMAFIEWKGYSNEVCIVKKTRETCKIIDEYSRLVEVNE